MYCRTCGKSIDDRAVICIHCGCKPLSGRAYCQNCGKETREQQEICLVCGLRLKRESTSHSFLSDKTVVEETINLDFSGLPLFYQEEFQKIYDSDEAYKGRFNIFAFLFAGIWCLTKGLWLPALIWILISFVTSGIGGIVFGILAGIRGNYWYYCSHVKNIQKLI
jgi:hypothetical protein